MTGDVEATKDNNLPAHSHASVARNLSGIINVEPVSDEAVSLRRNVEVENHSSSNDGMQHALKSAVTRSTKKRETEGQTYVSKRS